MFGHRFFGRRFYGNRYFGDGGSGAGSPTETWTDYRIRRKRRLILAILFGI